MSDLVPTNGSGAVAHTDGANHFKAVQQKLKTLGMAMDMSKIELDSLLLGMRMNAQYAEGLAAAIANADVDPKFVEMTNQVSLALGGAAVEVRKLHETAEEVSSLAHDAQRRHARLYEGLDTIRSGRKERTPKPGFFAH